MMETTYKVTQQVQVAMTVKDETVFQTDVKRLAEYSFKRLCEDFPDRYFELLEIKQEVNCLNYSGKTNHEREKTDCVCWDSSAKKCPVHGDLLVKTPPAIHRGGED